MFQWINLIVLVRIELTKEIRINWWKEINVGDGSWWMIKLMREGNLVTSVLIFTLEDGLAA